MPIWPWFRIDLTEEEFLAKVAAYNIEIWLVGNCSYLVFYSERTTRKRAGAGTRLSGPEAVEFVRNQVTRSGEPRFKFIGSTVEPSVVALAYTEAGRAEAASDRQWRRRTAGPRHDEEG